VPPPEEPEPQPARTAAATSPVTVAALRIAPPPLVVPVSHRYTDPAAEGFTGARRRKRVSPP
jgi:hypothetical protein